jgi:hypothetical protein
LSVAFPAIPLPLALAIGVPVCLAGFAAQEILLRRRAAGRRTSAPSPPDENQAAPEGAAPPAVEAPRPSTSERRPRPRAARRPAAGTARGQAPAARAWPAPDAQAALRKRHHATRTGLEAIAAFVDSPARRAGARACADALLLAVPKDERGPRVSAFLRAAGAKDAPDRLQELAHEAGVELATRIEELNAALRAAAPPH